MLRKADTGEDSTAPKPELRTERKQRGEALTVVGNDGPGHGGSVDAANHPEHAEPTEVLAPLLPGQDFSKVGEYSGNGASNPVKKCRGHMRLGLGRLRGGEANPE